MRPQTLRVALTGGIGTGKSEALKAFKHAGAKTLCLDEMAHELSRKGQPGYRAIVRAFGKDILATSGEINRPVLGSKVFSWPILRKKLERALHPIILRRMRRTLRSMRGVVVADVPLLYEAGLAKEFDASVVVTCSRRAQIARVMKRGNLSRTEVLARLKAQWPMPRKEALADVVIRNDETIATLRFAARQYHKAFALMAASPA